MVKLSYIVPVYNAAPYLRKCVDSILAQDYDDYEIILVDDGSTDDSGAICDEYVNKSQESRVKSQENPLISVIHQENTGVGAARNTGIKVASGEYICFVDSDDYWEPNMLGGLMKQVERDNLDVLRFKYQNINEQGLVFNPNKSDPYSQDDYSESVTDGVTFLNHRLGTACYTVVYIMREALLQDCLFVPGVYFEDSEWLPRMLVRAKRIASTDRIVYNYLIHQGSITKAIQKEKRQKLLDDKMSLLRSLQTQAISLREEGQEIEWFNRMIADVVISIISILSAGFYSHRKKYLESIQRMQVYPIQSLTFKARLINISPRVAVALLHIKRILSCK